MQSFVLTWHSHITIQCRSSLWRNGVGTSNNDSSPHFVASDRSDRQSPPMPCSPMQTYYSSLAGSNDDKSGRLSNAASPLTPTVNGQNQQSGKIRSCIHQFLISYTSSTISSHFLLPGLAANVASLTVTCQEIMTAMEQLAGQVQRLDDRIGRMEPKLEQIYQKHMEK